jgi:hypothetical protein
VFPVAKTIWNTLSRCVSQDQAGWLTPVILATQEVEIRRITVPGQPRQKVRKTPMSTNKTGVLVHACNPSYDEGISKRIVVQGWPGKSKTLFEK